MNRVRRLLAQIMTILMVVTGVTVAPPVGAPPVAEANANASWPSLWSSYPVAETPGGSVEAICDPDENINPSYLDLIGVKEGVDCTKPSIQLASFQSVSDTYLFLRFRVLQDPFANGSTTDFAQQVILLSEISLDGATTTATIGLSGAGSDTIYIQSGGTLTSRPIAAPGNADPQLRSLAVGTPVGDGTGHYFVDVKFPMSWLAMADSRLSGNTLKMLYGSSTQTNNINKDYLGGSSGSLDCYNCVNPVKIGPAELKVVTSLSPTTAPTVGQASSYTLSYEVSNRGMNSASSVVLQDTLPSGVSIGAIADPSVSVSGQTIIWVMGSLGATGKKTLSVPVTVTPTAGQWQADATVSPGASVTGNDAVLLDMISKGQYTGSAALTALGNAVSVGPVKNPVPTLTGISPNLRGTGSGAFTLTVDGANFQPREGANGSVVRINGTDYPTTYVSGTRLTAAIPASVTAVDGTYAVTVYNPDSTPTYGGGTSGALTLTVAVIPNAAPVITKVGDKTVGSDTLTFNATELSPLSLTLLATDPEGSALTWSMLSVAGQPTGAVDPSTGVFTWTPGESHGGGTYTFKVQVSDGDLTATVEFTVAVTEANAAPVITTVGGKNVGSDTLSFTGTEHSPLTLTLAATDADTPAQSLTWSMVTVAGQPAGTINPSTGVFTWTPGESHGPGTYTFTAQVSDGMQPTTVEFTVTVTEVNVAPVITKVGTKNVGSDTLAFTGGEHTPLGLTLVATDADLPAQTLTWSLLPVAGQPSGSIDAGTGAFTWTPGESHGGNSYTFQAQVTDGSQTDTVEFTVSVTETNAVPVITKVGDKTVGADTLTFTSAELSQLSLALAGSDPDGSALTWSMVTLPGQPTGTINAGTGAFTWTPGEAQGPGTYTFKVQVSDGSLTATVEFTVNVTEVNEAPVITKVGTKNVGIDTLAFTGTEHTQLSLTLVAADADLPAQSLTWSLVPVAGQPSGAIDAGTGEFTWTPGESHGSGSYTFQAQVTDGGQTDTVEFTVSVTETNAVPVITKVGEKTVGADTLTFTSAELSQLSLALVGSDPDGSALTWSMVTLPGQPTGTINAGTGAFTWTPGEAQGPGTYTFKVQVSDGSLTATVEFTVNVTEVNEAPVITKVGTKNVGIDTLAFTGTEHTQLSLTLVAADADLPAQSLTWSLLPVAGQPSGAIDASTGVFTWTPGESHGGGTYTFQAQVTDGSQTDTVAFTVTVSEVNAAPAITKVEDKTVGSDTLAFTATEHTMLSLTLLGSDPDGSPLTWSMVPVAGQPAGGINPITGEFTWTPGESHGGNIYTFRVQVSDGALTATVEFTVTVTEVNAAPTITKVGTKTVGSDTLAFTATEHSLLSLTLLGSDPDGSPLTWSMVPVAGQPAGSIDAGTGEFTWTPGESHGGNIYTFKVRVSDGDQSATVEFTVNVTETDAAPVITKVGEKSVATDELAFTVAEDNLLSLTLVATDADLPAQTLTWSLIALVGQPAGSINASTGNFTWTPGESHGGGTYRFKAQVTDGGQTAAIEFTVAVTEAGAAPVITKVGAKTVGSDTLAFTGAEHDLLSLALVATDADVPAQTLTWSLLPVAGQPAGSIDPDTGVFTWTPRESHGGNTYTFKAQVSDGSQTATVEFTVAVTEVNAAPAITKVGEKNVGADSLTFTAAELSQLSLTLLGSDPDGSPLNWSLVPVAGQPAGSIDTGTGVFTWTPGEAHGPGTYTFKAQVSDGSLTATVEFTVNVTEVNDAPVITRVGTKTVGSDTLVFTGTEHSQLSLPLVATDADAPAQTLTWSLLPVAGQPSGSINANTGVFTWTPGESHGGDTYTFKAHVSDGALTATVEFTVTVAEAEAAPVITQVGTKVVDTDTLAFTSHEHDQLNLPLIAADADIPAQALTWSMLPVADQPAGTIDAGTGEFTWAPGESYGGGTYTFKAQVSDGSQTDTVEFTVTVAETNSAPEITRVGTKVVGTDALAFTGMEHDLLRLTLVATDADLPAETLTWSMVAMAGEPAGNINTGTGEFTWTPAEHHGGGIFTFKAKVTDSGNPARAAEVTFTVAVTEHIPPAPASGTIYGTVRSETGGAIENLTVELVNAAGAVVATARTDANGRYEFRPVVPGSYEVVAPSRARPLGAAGATVAAGQVVQVDLRLGSNATLALSAAPQEIVGDGVSTTTLTALILFKDGRPAGGVPVRFEASAGRLAATQATSGANGQAPVVLTAPLIEGVTPRQERATAVVRNEELGIFAEATVLIRFLPASIEGVVTDGTSGRPVAGALVELAEDFDGDGVVDFRAQATTGTDGRYRFVVPRGNWNYKVQVTAPVQVQGRKVMVKSTQTSRVGQLRGIGEKINATRKVVGQIFVVADATQGPKEAGSVLQKGAVSGTIRPAGGGVERPVRMNPDGTYEVDELEPGQYDMLFQVTAPNGTKLAGTRVRVAVNQDGQLAIQTPLIDPYGIVRDDVTGAPVEGVKMSLYWADTTLNKEQGRTPGGLVNLPTLVDFAPNQNKVPQWTTAAGAYAWMVFPDGDYYIVAEKAGYVTYDSRDERRNVPAGPGEDSYVTNGIIHVGTTIVEYDLKLKRVGQQTPVKPADPVPTPADPKPQPPQQPESGRHRRYIFGYPDGTFKPSNHITRAEVATILARIVAPDEKAQGLAPFPDVAATHWANNYIALVVSKGLMIGYPDGTFRPEGRITRAEVATMAMRFKALQPLVGKPFPDTLGHWAEANINTVLRGGYMTGYPEGDFRPNQPITRAEFVTVMNRLIDRGPLTELPKPSWPDVPTSHWAYGHVEEASTNHLYERKPDRSERWKGFWQP